MLSRKRAGYPGLRSQLLCDRLFWGLGHDLTELGIIVWELWLKQELTTEQVHHVSAPKNRLGKQLKLERASQRNAGDLAVTWSTSLSGPYKRKYKHI